MDINWINKKGIKRNRSHALNYWTKYSSQKIQENSLEIMNEESKTEPKKGINLFISYPVNRKEVKQWILLILNQW